ncbi:2,4-dihydroxyhept-2-enedioate aldolase [Octadecabacter temperatus]|uniref:Hydroxypyruvate/pyruvate aldolase n=1 Tax=Octadecabacter temperatus TaxID=1458307 RepID=A0A0K0Y4R4_9RHOB|nr:HpcH/HpaI aldolase/citrate lyase family protein [Octadecabacter temperatus]AKS45949.1 4-hydroxy-2-oxo-heptane-1,7-dioate aldolase [Octadecabacter temperatus]SIO04202.1 2,4-dihydroxyhept-2-enedioate aldolase [Octadecabacter temperatus]
MPAPQNALKAALDDGDIQNGLWLTLASGAVAEIAGKAGFDWCLIDAEHGPNTLTTIQTQLQALAGTPAQAVVRVPSGEDWILKQVLDLGVQTVVVPMVNTAQQAALVASAVRYPGQGSRGMGATLARASGYGEIVDYVSSANEQIFLFVQIESTEAVENVDAIAATPGVDGIFVGPADLSADMGFVGQMDAPEVIAAIDHVYERAKAAGKAIGTVVFDASDFQNQIDKGVTFLGLGADSFALQTSLRTLASKAP